jgi:hypothetical protein
MTTTQVTHEAQPVITHLGGGAKTILYRIVDNVGRLVCWERDKATAERLVAQLSQPRVDE